MWIPSLLRNFTGGESKVVIPGDTLRELLDNMEKRYPGVRRVLVQEELIREDIAVAIDGEISHQGLFQLIGKHSEVHFIPAVAGGQPSI